MAKAYAKCATEGCGNSILFIEQNRKLADRKAAWAELQGFICSDCEDKKRAEENAKAAAQNAELGLPALTGSEKQIAWAEKIRADKLTIVNTLSEMPIYQAEYYWNWDHLNKFISNDDIESAIAQCNGDNDEISKTFMHLPIIQKGLELLKAQTKSSWWIDNRDTKLSAIVAELLKTMPIEQPAENKKLEVDAAAEATVRPEEPKTETIAEIQCTAKGITVKFPEKIESFRLLMRKHGFEWSGSAWVRTLLKRNGDPQDRAAEIGHILLGSGFIIRIYDEDVRAKAISGGYTEEQTRWILLYTSGAEQGRLCIHWSRDEDYYRAAKRLSTARYSKPNISVAVEQFEQVLDFAEVNGFSISAEAQAVIDAAREARDAAFVAHVELVGKVKHSDDGKPVKLDVPDSVEVDDELRD